VTRLLIERCDHVVTVDDAGTELAGSSILAEDGVDRDGRAAGRTG